MNPLLAVEELTVALPARGELRAAGAMVSVVRGVSFELHAGEAVALVGESGAGKSISALALIGLLPPGARVAGRVMLDGENLLSASPRRLREIRGRSVAMVFQEPMTALDPAYSIGFQLAEVLRAHRQVTTRRQAKDRAVRLLEQVAMPNPGERLRAYPHQLSGGQRQRVVLAMALAGEPKLLIADEPTTALDVTVQAEILELLSKLRSELGLCVLLITHDLGVVAQTCDRAMVMYGGELVELARVESLFAEPAHPYTQALLAASPRLSTSGATASADAGVLATIPGQVPEPARLPPGCPFHPRCGARFEPCSEHSPELARLEKAPLEMARLEKNGLTDGERQVRCWLYSSPPLLAQDGQARRAPVDAARVEKAP